MVIHGGWSRQYLRRAPAAGWPTADLTEEEEQYFLDELALHEGLYLTETDPRRQSGFGRDERDWERYRRLVVAPVDRSGTFLDIGCANGLLMESAVAWARASGHRLEVYGLDISEKLVALARRRLPHWRDRLFVGNALFWTPPVQFDFVRTEMVYVPRGRRREYLEHLMGRVVAPGGKLIVCSYGSSRSEGRRAELLVDELQGWEFPLAGLYDTSSPEHGFVITRVIALSSSACLPTKP